MLLLVFLCVCIFIGSLAYYYIQLRSLQSQLRQRFGSAYKKVGYNAPPLRMRRNSIKWLLPLLSVFSPINMLFPLGKLRRWINKRIMMASWPFTVNEFLVLSEFSSILFVIFYVLLMGKIPSIDVIVILAIIGFAFPFFVLNNHISKRKKSIRKELPNVIDLLKLCVDAGMDFMLAVKRVIRDYKPCPLTEELADVWRQIQMGRSRTDALKHFAWKLDMPEVSSFVRALIQGDKLGTPIGEILRSQAEEMRLLRVLQAEEVAMKAPVKMLFPLLFFIMPVILIIVAGPVILQFVRGDIFSMSIVR